MIRIVLDGAPRGKERVRRARDGHAFTPERTVAFEGRMALAAQTVMAGRPLLTGALVLDVKMFMAIPASWSKKKQASARSGEMRPTTKPDWDNGGKLTDSLNLVVWVDDAQIVDGRVQKFYSDRPRTEIIVSEVELEQGLFS